MAVIALINLMVSYIIFGIVSCSVDASSKIVKISEIYMICSPIIFLITMFFAC